MSDQPESKAESSEPSESTEASDSARASESPETAAAAAEVEPKPSADSAEPAEPGDAAVLDAAGRERPRFLLNFPEDPALARLSAAFEAGNYALVRAEAGTLAERAEDPRVRDAAFELARRIEPDPLVKYLLAVTAALLLFLGYFAYHH